jgi:hypothetical protein
MARVVLALKLCDLGLDGLQQLYTAAKHKLGLR